jgi:hypothetical protein
VLLISATTRLSHVIREIDVGNGRYHSLSQPEIVSDKGFLAIYRRHIPRGASSAAEEVTINEGSNDAALTRRSW